MADKPKDSPKEVPKKRGAANTYAKGMAIAFASVVSFGPLASMWAAKQWPEMGIEVYLVPWLRIGLVQLVWIVPEFLYFLLRRQWKTSIGLWIGAGLVALLRAAALRGDNFGY